MTAAPAALRYAIGLTLFVVALLGRMALTGFLPAQGFPFLTFFPAVLLTAYFAGFSPGIFCSALSVLAAWFFFTTPAPAFLPLTGPNAVALAFFAAILVVDCIVVHAMKTALARVRHTELQLRHSEQQLRLVIDQLFAYVGVLDLQGRLQEVNSAPLELRHITREQVMGLPFWETPWWVGDAAREEEVRSAVQRAAGGETVRYDVEIQASPTDRLTIDFQLAPLRDGAGLVRAIVASGVDVSDRVHALAEGEQSRRDAVSAAQHAEAERRVLDATLNAVPASIIVADATGKLVRMNSASERIWGAAPYSDDVDEYAEWKGWWADGSARHGQRINAHEWGLARSLQGEICTDVVEIEPFGRPGERRVTLLSSAPVLDPGGTVVGGVVAQVDITERIQMEHALRDSQQLLQSTMDNFPTIIAFTDRDGRFLDVNKALEVALGRTREEIRGLAAQDIMPLETAARVREQEVTVMRTRRAVQIEQTQPMPGGLFHYLDTTFPLIDARGDVYGVGHISHDISDRKRAEQTLNTANEQLRLADRQKDEFLATLAHELRNPLAPILAAAEMIRLREPADAMVRLARDIIERQVLHLTRLVDDLLDVSRITTGTVTLRQERLDLSAMAASAVESLRSTVDAAGLRLVHEPTAAPLAVCGDSTRLVQCIVNLLGNAVKFTPRGGSVAVRVAAEGELAVLEVRDSGIGIAPADLERVFDLFVQLQRSGMQGNTGLGIGLALTRKLVTLHGGTIQALRNDPDPGSCFRIELPLAPAGEEDRPARDRPLHGAPDANRIEVLVVDDNRDAADTLSMMLAMRGFDVGVAYDGATALTALAGGTYQAVLLDIGLPDIDGYEVCRRIRATLGQPQPVVLALTGWGQERDRQAAATAGFDAHVSKPADPEQLIALIKNQLLASRLELQPVPQV